MAMGRGTGRGTGATGILVGGGLLITLLVGLLVALDPQRQQTTWNDTYRYVATIERILGHDAAEARSIALHWYCADEARTSGGATHAATCVAGWTRIGGLAPNTARYNAIFDARPGYPLLVAPFAAVLGLNAGLAVVAWLVTIAAGWLCLLLARLAGLGVAGSLGSMVALYCLPTFFWLQQDLTEGVTLACTLVLLVGSVLVLRGRVVAGLVVSTLAYAAGLLIRYSTFSLQAVCLAGCLFVLALLGPEELRTRRTIRLAGYHAGAFVILTVIPMLLGWPGFRESLTDTFSDHFTHAVPGDLYGHWLSLIGRYIASLGRLYGGDPILPLLVVAGLVLLWRGERLLAALVSAAALTGIGSALAHPLASQGSRLYVQVFLLAVFGLGLGVDLAHRSLLPRLAAERVSRVRREDDVN
ncbi:hypothetical protein KDL01_04195 [Actinospica durhamensis]|uniref:Uncharacterized protein n=1 Tax=Actinospica durhamensis TaxID=1508375 RepID=A0A941ELA9_9ACTN|nr:hypothetical protein [Actinospica durhamensis]MBR7832443.1 hypothetical protein [Actinospica durhamensis]